MGLELKTSLKLSQQLVMTPQLQQAIKLLQLGRMELLETINEELLENPLLEVEENESGNGASDSAGGDSDGAAEPVAAPAEEKTPEVEVTEQDKQEFDWENYLGEYSSAPASGEGSFREDSEAPSYDNVLSKPTSLKEHLLWQLQMSAMDGDQMEIGELIIGNLNDDGYLAEDLDALAESAGVEPERVETVLAVVQQLDPLGVAARDLRECLLIQATVLYPGYDLVHEILENHLGDLEKRHYRQIARKQGATLEEVAEALDVIRCLDPKPGRTVNDDEPRYITPDIYVYKMDDDFVVVLNEDGLPKLRVNNFYRKALGAGSPAEAKEYVQSKLRGAQWLIRSIHQRQRTIRKVTESLVKFQRPFFEKGIAHLKPLVLREVADDVGMHESTISRVTTNKYVHTPQGVYELKFFFNSGINRVQGEAMASEAVKDRIRRLVAGENSAKPLSDQAIADMLKKENINIARRTVAKYRELLGILPSSRRRQTLGGAGRKGR